MMKNKIKQSINLLLSIFTIWIPKSEKIWILGSWFGERFADNSRYMFLYANKNKEKLGLEKIIWITKSDNIYQELKKQGYEVYKY